MKKVKLGSEGPVISREGLGCMGMSDFQGATMYGTPDEAESIATIHRAIELGVTMLDTADMYGPYENERLLGKALAGGKREQVTLATKFGWEINDEGAVTYKFKGDPAYVRKSIERSLTNLGTDHVDLYYLHRLDPDTPIEETVGAMSRLVEEGKVKYLGLSEVPVGIIRRAHAVHPITAIQTEYSLFERTVEENGVLDTCRELGIGFVGHRGLILPRYAAPEFGATRVRQRQPGTG